MDDIDPVGRPQLPKAEAAVPQEESFYVAVEWLVRTYYLFWLWFIGLLAKGRFGYEECITYWAVVAFCLWPDRLMPKSWRESPRVRWVVCAMVLFVVFVVALLGLSRMNLSDQCAMVWMITSYAAVGLYARWLRSPFTNLTWGSWLAVLLLNAWCSHPEVNAVGKLINWLSR